MARKVVNFTADDEGRDKGKTFVITEMSASQCENWALRAILALTAGGVEVPEGFERLGMAGMAELGIRALAGLKFDLAKPLLDEMLGCVSIMPDASRPHVVRPLIDEDIEEVMTRVRLRAEVWKLHTDFLQAVAPSNTAKASRTARQKG